LPQAPSWFSCFNVIQLNEDEIGQLGSDPLAIAADAMRQGCTALCVTLGARGAAYFTGDPIRTARIPAPAVHPAVFPQESDPTGCGDVFGGATAAALLAGASIEDALRLGTQLGTRNLSHHGASGLRDHLMGKLSIA
jgi:sugar/nucleoside kinase (ribokinase family)